jgi:hypothetical protein
MKGERSIVLRALSNPKHCFDKATTYHSTTGASLQAAQVRGTSQLAIKLSKTVIRSAAKPQFPLLQNNNFVLNEK